MKRHTTFALITLLILSGLAVAVLGEDRDGQTIRLRTGSVLKFDTGSSIKDEDGNWTLSNTSLSYLSTLATTPRILKNFATTNTPATLTNLIQSIDGALSSSNDWVGSFTGNGSGLTNLVTDVAAGTNGIVVTTNGTLRTVSSSGVFYTVSATNFTLFGTTNQIIFGATNTQPATTSAVFWVSCKVTGLTNEFRAMLVSP